MILSRRGAASRFMTPRWAERLSLSLEQTEQLCALLPLTLWEGSLATCSDFSYTLSDLISSSEGGEKYLTHSWQIHNYTFRQS